MRNIMTELCYVQIMTKY